MKTVSSVGALVAATLVPGAVLAEAQSVQLDSVEVVVVTARKRAETLQEVPMAITALSAGMLERRGITAAKDLFAVTPGLYYSQSGQRQNDEQFFLTLRGVGATPVVEPSVAVFVDGAYMPSLGWTMDFLDVERVEILRGPQGALFGRNTEGGALNIVTKLPGEELRLNFGAEVADFESRRLNVSVAGPISERLSGGLAAFGSTTDGYMRNATRGEPQDDRERAGARAVLRFEPRAGAELVWSADYLSSEGRFDALGDPASEATITIADPHAASAAGSTIRSNALAGRRYTTYGQSESTTDVRNYGSTLNARFDLGWSELASISAYRSIRSIDQYDADGTASAEHINGATTEQRELAQELRLTSTQSSDVEWIAGVYGFTDDLEQRRLSRFVSGVAVGPQAGAPYGYTQDDVEIARDGVAVFGQLDWHITDRLAAALGLRYSHERVEQTPDLHVRVRITPGPGDVTVDNTTPRSESFSGWSPSLSLSYRITSDMFAYASVATGFKAGGFARELQNTPEQNRPIDNETSVNYELGLKGEAIDGRLFFALAAYYTALDDQQLTVRVPLTPGSPVAVPSVQNAGKSRIQGFELETTAQPFQDFTINAALAYTDAQFDEFIADTGGGIVYDRAGQKFPEVPEWTGSAFAQYAWHFGDGYTLTPRVTWRYVDEKFVGQGAASSPFVHIDSYDIMDAQISLARGKWTLTAFANNLTDEYYFTSRTEIQGIFAPPGRTSYARPGAPRQIGLRVAFQM